MEESRWEEKGPGQLVNSCPGLLHNLPMMGEEKGSLADAWERLSHPRGRLWSFLSLVPWKNQVVTCPMYLVISMGIRKRFYHHNIPHEVKQQQNHLF